MLTAEACKYLRGALGGFAVDRFDRRNQAHTGGNGSDHGLGGRNRQFGAST